MSQLPEKEKKQKVHFLHIGKTGGSAVKSVLNDFLETHDYSLKLHGHNISLGDIPKGELVVFFLREPISRFISGFYSRHRKGQPKYHNEWTPKEKEIFEHFSTPNEIAVSLASNQELALKAMNNIQHFRRYNEWFIDFDYFNSRLEDILFIGFQESLNEDFEKLKKILEIPQNTTLPTDDVTAHKNPVNVDKTMDEKGLSALREWYAEDFKFISLCKEIMSKMYHQL